MNDSLLRPKPTHEDTAKVYTGANALDATQFSGRDAQCFPVVAVDAALGMDGPCDAPFFKLKTAHAKPCPTFSEFAPAFVRTSVVDFSEVRL